MNGSTQLTFRQVRPRLPFLTLLAVCLQLQSCDAGGGERSLFKNSKNVVEFEPETFKEKVLDSKRAWYVDYYADWCGHCRHFAPIWEEVAAWYKTESRVTIGALNCARFGKFCASIGVRSYPTLRAYNFPDMNHSREEQGAQIERGRVGDAKGLREKLLQTHIDKLPYVSRSSSSQEVVNLTHPPPMPQPPTAAPSVQPKVASLTKQPSSLRGAGSAPEATVKAGAGEGDSSAAVTRSTPEESASLRLLDAEVAIVYSLRQAAYVSAGEKISASASQAGSPAADNVATISGEALTELVLWLDFLSTVFPNKRASKSLRKLADYVRSAKEDRGALVRSTWVEVLEHQAIDRVPTQAGEDPTAYWRVCATYTCGLWTLFHILTVCVAEAQQSSVHVFHKDGGTKPAQALARIRGFVNHFFGCADCRSHFLDAFDNCKFGRCDLRSDDGPGAVLWLWQQHNAVTRRVAAEDTPPRLVLPWPPRGDCHACWLEENSERWDSSAVYAHLRRTFWRSEWWTASAAESIQSSGFDMGTMPEFALFGGFMAIAAAAIMLWYGVPGRARRSRMKGC